MTPTTYLVRNFEYRIGRRIDAGMTSRATYDRAFVAVAASLFTAAAVLTIAWSSSMSAMRGMPMPGGWAMSMTWMRMPGQTWFGAAASFTGMWVVMMTAMMLPSFAPMLWRYRQAVSRTYESRRATHTALVGLGYFFVWTVIGLALYPVGAAIGALEMTSPALSRSVPVAVAVVLFIAGAVQFTPWKAHRLACCREAPGCGRILAADAGTAWRQGIRFGAQCGLSCANLTAILLALGVMDLRVMSAVTAAITAERLAPAGDRIARGIGFVAVGAGLVLIARAAGIR